MHAMETVGDLLRDASRDLAAEFDAVPIPGALRYALDLPAPPRQGSPVGRLDQPRGRVAMLAGPGVLRDRAVDGLRAFAEAANVGVANTWGAKGVFPWDSPHHLGTCGLQADDFELLGFADLDLLWVTGLDPAESPAARYELGAKVVPIAPADLQAFADHVARSSYPIVLPPLFERLAAVAQPGYVDDRFPRHPARAVIEIKQRTEPGALVTADPGPAGLWVARTFPTDGPGSVVVPAVARPGIATALALAATRAGHAATAVTIDPIDDTTQALLELADTLAAPVTLEVWGDDVDLSLTALLTDAAGPVVAWGS
jgi:thiamine pyrophosphate-dependent acetolactate synthase large subunit-like protein